LAESKLEESGKLKHGAAGVLSLEMADANTAAASYDDGCVALWDLRETQKPVGLLQGADSSSTMMIKFLPNNPTQLISGGDSGNISFWDLKTFRLKLTRGYTGTGASSAASKVDTSKYDAS